MHIIKTFAVVALIVITTACAQVETIVKGPDVNLTQKSYAAADFLIQQSRSFVSRDTKIKIGSLQNLENAGDRAAFGQVIAGQIGARFVQLGYNVTSDSIDRMLAGSTAQPTIRTLPPSAAFGDSPANTMAGAFITGHYVSANNQVLVNLTLVEPSTGRVFAAYDYTVPYNSDIRALLENKAITQDSVATTPVVSGTNNVAVPDQY